MCVCVIVIVAMYKHNIFSDLCRVVFLKDFKYTVLILVRVEYFIGTILQKKLSQLSAFSCLFSAFATFQLFTILILVQIFTQSFYFTYTILQSYSIIIPGLLVGIIIKKKTRRGRGA